MKLEGHNMLEISFLKAIEPKIILPPQRLDEEIIKIGHRKFVINYNKPYFITDFCPGETFTFSNFSVNRDEYTDVFVFLKTWTQYFYLGGERISVGFFNYRKIGEQRLQTESLVDFNLSFLKQIW